MNRREVLAAGWSLAKFVTHPIAMYRVIEAGAIVSLATSSAESVDQTLVVPELAKLGKELEEWTLANGVRMVQVFPDVKKASSLFQGRFNRDLVHPTFTPPIRLEDDDVAAAVRFRNARDQADPRQVRITTPANVDYDFAWVNNSFFWVRIAPDLLQSTARLPVLTKEASHIYDYVEYTKIYKAKVEAQGVRFDFLNPTNKKTSPGEMLVNFGSAIVLLENELFGTSDLNPLLDFGSALKVGGILFANWLEDQKRQGIQVPDTYWVRAGYIFRDFLKEKGLITERNGVIVWTKGQPPGIANKEILVLAEECRTKYGKKLIEVTKGH